MHDIRKDMKIEFCIHQVEVIQIFIPKSSGRHVYRILLPNLCMYP